MQGVAYYRRVLEAVLCCICGRQIDRPTLGQLRAKEPCCGRGGCAAELHRRQERRR
jgi:hypothetical protein